MIDAVFLTSYSQPLRGDIVPCGAEIPKYQHGRIWRGSGPPVEFYVRRSTDLPERIEALFRDHVEDAAALSRSFHSVSLKVLSNSVFCGCCAGSFEIGAPQCGFFCTAKPTPPLTQSWAEDSVNAEDSNTTARIS